MPLSPAASSTSAAERGGRWTAATRRSPADPCLYTGIDPSPGALGWFALKHPAFRDRLVRTTLEEYETPQRFDVIVMANVGRDLIAPGYPLDEKLRSLLVPGGRAVIWDGGDARRSANAHSVRAPSSGPFAPAPNSPSPYKGRGHRERGGRGYCSRGIG